MEMAESLADTFLGKACSVLAAEGSPFVGTLYAGLILTPEGPKALEYNCRLGDPETQAILPLLESDFGEIIQVSNDHCHVDQTVFRAGHIG